MGWTNGWMDKHEFFGCPSFVAGPTFPLFPPVSHFIALYVRTMTRAVHEAFLVLARGGLPVFRFFISFFSLRSFFCRLTFYNFFSCLLYSLASVFTRH